MTKLILKEGDLFTSNAPAYGHGVNTSGVMGKGIAPLFKHQFPGMFDKYRSACRNGALRPGEVFIWSASTPIVYNIASQSTPGRTAQMDWLESGMDFALWDASKRGFRTLAVPRIGCGIGGLNWLQVEPLLARIASGYSTDLEVWSI